MKKLLLLTFLVLIQPCLSFSKDYEFYEADIGRCMVLKFNDNTGAVSLQQYKYDTCSSRQTYLIPMVRTAARYEVLIKETDGDFIDYVFLSEEVLINSNADGAIVEHRLKDPERQELSRAIEAGKSFNIAYFNGVYWTGPRFDLPKRIEPILAIECSTDPKECTPKKLCEFATDQDGSNTVWSDASNKVKHVRFAQSLGMTCGVITIVDPCDTDPNDCKIKQLCEKATTDNGGQTFWNRAAQDYVEVAKKYGMTCGVPAKTIIREFNPLETEANNNPSDADDIVSGKAITGQLHSSSDKDYFAIVAEGAGIISVNFETSYNSGNAYYTVSLVDSDGKVLASQKTGQDTKFSAGISNAATYYVVVSGATYYTGEEYKITAQTTVTNTKGVETEANNNPSDADDIVSGKAITGQLHSSSDKDYFAIVAEGAGTISVNFETSYNSGNAYYTVSLVDSDGKVLASQKTGWDTKFSAGISNAATYYVVVSGATYYTGEEYKITAQTTVTNTKGVETEANNNPSVADDIVSGKAITGQLHSSSDKDYFAIVAEGAGTISVNFETSYNSGNAYYTVSLVDSDGKVLASQKTGWDTKFSAGISNAATYYVVVSGATYYTGEEYKITAQTTVTNTKGVETEANNNPSVADDIVSGKAITGQLHSSSDKDYFAIVAEGAGTISVNFETSYNSGNAYYTVSLVDSDGKVLASQKTGRDTKFSAGISNAATYYVVVSGATYYTGEEYKITAQTTVTNTKGVETEANNNPSDADDIVSGKAITGQLHSSSDKDYFAIVAEGAGTISVNFETSYNSGNAYYTVSLVDSDGNVLASQKTGQDTKFSAGISNAATYYAIVSGATYYTGKEYKLTAQTTVTNMTGAETEANNNPSDAGLPNCVGNYASETWSGCLGQRTYSNGAQYVGEFMAGLRHGKGTHTYSNGSKYVGNWEDDKRDGQGTFEMKTALMKIVQDGLWENDVFQGENKMETPARKRVGSNFMRWKSP